MFCVDIGQKIIVFSGNEIYVDFFELVITTLPRQGTLQLIFMKNKRFEKFYIFQLDVEKPKL